MQWFISYIHHSDMLFEQNVPQQVGYGAWTIKEETTHSIPAFMGLP